MDFFNCLGDQDSCVGKDAINQDYEILNTNISTPLVPEKSPSSYIGNSDSNGLSPDLERFGLLNPIQGTPLQSAPVTRHVMTQEEKKDRNNKTRRKQKVSAE